MTLGRRLAARVAAVTLALGVAGIAVPPGAQAAPCSSAAGVTVVVGSDVRCAPGDPSSAGGALTAAGFSVTPVQRFPGAICRIDGAPASDRCVQMPPTSAYWSVWTAGRGGTWRYSSQGAYSVDPAPGTVVGFAFGSGSPPAAPPPAALARPTSSAPRPTTTARPTARPSAGATPQPGAPDSPASTGPGGEATTPGAAPSGTAGSTAGEATPGQTTSGTPARPAGTKGTRAPSGTTTRSGTAAGAPEDVRPSADAPAEESSGIPVSTLAAAGLLLVLAGAGIVLARRRRDEL